MQKLSHRNVHYIDIVIVVRRVLAERIALLGSTYLPSLGNHPPTRVSDDSLPELLASSRASARDPISRSGRRVSSATVHWRVRVCFNQRRASEPAKVLRNELSHAGTNNGGLFGERANSFIPFFQRSVRWAAGQRARSRINRDYAHSFQLIVNSYALANACPSPCTRAFAEADLFDCTTTAICNRTLSRGRSVDHTILTSAYTHSEFFFPSLTSRSRLVDMACRILLFTRS